MKRRALMPAVLALIVVFPVVARASVVLTEDPIEGYIGPIPGITGFDGEGNGVGNIGSDGVDPFDPVGFGAGISDFIELGRGWSPMTPDAGAFASGFWTRFGVYWVLPEVTTPGSGSEPPYEPVAKWYLSGQRWSTSQEETFILVNPDGTISDIITLDNTGPGPNGSAAITFASDPIPEPATLVLWSGLGAMGLVTAWRRRKRTV